jgi:hypothetical protein
MFLRLRTLQMDERMLALIERRAQSSQTYEVLLSHHHGICTKQCKESCKKVLTTLGRLEYCAPVLMLLFFE